jgi:hypothetical protein
MICIRFLTSLPPVLWSLWIPRDTWLLKSQGRWSCTRRPKLGDIGSWPKRKALTPFDQKWQAAIKRFSFFGVSAKDNSKDWAMRRLSQLLVLVLLSASILLYQFLQPALEAKASSGKHIATGEALIKPLWKGFFGIRLQWTRGDRKFPQVRGNKMSSWSQYESKARWKAPIKKRRREKYEVKIKRGNAEWNLRGWNLPEQLYFDSPLKIRALGKDDLGFGSGRRLRWIARRENRCGTDLTWRRWQLESISE